jgi:hypothetical protein
MMTSVPAARPAEQRTWHNRLQKLALAVDDSREYWRNADPSARPDEENLRAFTERWFGGKTMARVRVLMADFRSRYAAYPQALEVLRNLRGAHPDLLRLVCHWHLQLADPGYRTFTGVWLPERRSFEATVDFPSTLRWVIDTNPKNWKTSTARQMAGKLLSAATGAALIEPGTKSRHPLVPRVPDEAIGYLMHLLREIDFEGTILDNEYLASVGLAGGHIERRLLALPWIRVARTGNVMDAEWRYPTLSSWAEANL